jgi:hypothetical protein
MKAGRAVTTRGPSVCLSICSSIMLRVTQVQTCDWSCCTFLRSQWFSLVTRRSWVQVLSGSWRHQTWDSYIDGDCFFTKNKELVVRVMIVLCMTLKVEVLCHRRHWRIQDSSELEARSVKHTFTLRALRTEWWCLNTSNRFSTVQKARKYSINVHFWCTCSVITHGLYAKIDLQYELIRLYSRGKW